MNRFSKSWLLTGLSVLFGSSQVFAKDNPWEFNLPFQQAVIYYDISGSEKGTETLYMRDFGNERVKITKSKGKVLFVSTTTDTIEITTRETVINIDVDKKTGTRMTNPQKFMQEEMEKLSASERKIVNKNFETIGTNMAVQMGGQVKPKAGEHIGYTCDLVTVMGSTSCQMSGTPIMLKMESNILGIKLKTVAKKIERNASVPSDIFNIPDGVDVVYNKEADDASRAMIASMIESMKDPDAAKKFEEGMIEAETQMEQAQQQQDEEQEQPDEEQVDEAIQDGLKALKGLFD